MSQEQRKQALKALKAERAEAIKAAAAQAKQQKKYLDRIKERLTQGPATSVEIAQDLGMPPSEAIWYLSAMRKYGMVAETGKNGDYFNYQLVYPDKAAC